MFCEETRIKQGVSYISFCSYRILYNSKFILMATSLGTNVIVITRVHCINLPEFRKHFFPLLNVDRSVVVHREVGQQSKQNGKQSRS